jgi:hypothetical protein
MAFFLLSHDLRSSSGVQARAAAPAHTGCSTKRAVVVDAYRSTCNQAANRENGT